MATEVLMPQMGESIAEGTITRWLAKVGESVEREQPLLEISTDKVDSEIPSPASGVLLEIVHAEGVTVPVNEIVARIGEAGEATAETAGAPAAEKSGDAAAETTTTEIVVADSAGAAEEATGDISLEERIRRFSSPLVRNIAREEGVELADIEGSGVHGRVTKKDILGYLERRAAGEIEPKAASAPSSSAAVAPAPSTPAPVPAARPTGGFSVPAYGAHENVEVEPMSRIRQITSAHMTYSKATSAHVTTVFHIDMTRVDNLRRRAKARFLSQAGTKLTFMPFIFKAVSRGIRKYPQMNAAIDGTNVVYKKDVNLGMAVAFDRGLIVPVIKHADSLNVVGLARAANDLAERARSKKLKPEETQGGTFTVTNPGGFGSQFGTPVINQPQVAILSTGVIEKRPVVVTDADGADALAIRVMSYFAITFDHRLIDGADADHFMNVVKDTLEQGSWDELTPYL